MKQIAKHVLHGTLFVLILIVLLALCSHLFQPKGNRAEDGMYDTNPNGVLAEPENTVDVLILGDSEADCAFIPHKIWKDYGISVYICGLGGGNPHQSFGYLRQVFRTQSPKIVIVETNHLFGGFTLVDDAILRLEELLPIFRYHNRWKSLQLQDLTKPVRYDSIEYQKGYHFDWRIAPADTTGYMDYTEEVLPVNRNVVNCVRNMKQYCQDRGAELMLVSVPSAMNWNYKRHNGIAQLAEELDLQYIDMNLLRDEIPVDWSTETQDYGDHVNFIGALKVSEFTGRMLWNTGKFQDMRDTTRSENWDRVIATFIEVNGLEPDALDVSLIPE